MSNFGIKKIIEWFKDSIPLEYSRKNVRKKLQSPKAYLLDQMATLFFCKKAVFFNA